MRKLPYILISHIQDGTCSMFIRTIIVTYDMTTTGCQLNYTKCKYFKIFTWHTSQPVDTISWLIIHTISTQCFLIHGCLKFPCWFKLCILLFPECRCSSLYKLKAKITLIFWPFWMQMGSYIAKADNSVLFVFHLLILQ